MKCIAAVLVLIALSALVGHGALHRLESQPQGAVPSPPAAVVVELFTSEGCSSCPPADALLARLEKEQPVQGAKVIALEEHVDYWNSLGWVDPFSSGDWTTRQNVYAGTLGNGNPYTPQMVVNGSLEFVGSHESKARQAILQEVSSERTAVAVELAGPEPGNKERLSVRVGKLQKASPGDTPEVWLALTESGLHSSVTGGENAGENLRHASVVRSMRKLGAAKDAGEASFLGNAVVAIDKGWKLENLRAVIFLQERKSRRILGAAQVPLVS